MLAFADDAALARLVIAAAQRRARLTPELSDARPRTISGRLISLGHRPSNATITPCPSPAAATAPSRPPPRARTARTARRISRRRD